MRLKREGLRDAETWGDTQRYTVSGGRFRYIDTQVGESQDIENQGDFYVNGQNVYLNN